MKRPKEEIQSEIKALRALKPEGHAAHKTAKIIASQIDALENGVDDTCDEWEQLSEEEQMAIRDAQEWAGGDTETKPSEGFGGLVS